LIDQDGYRWLAKGGKRLSRQTFIVLAEYYHYPLKEVLNQCDTFMRPRRWKRKEGLWINKQSDVVLDIYVNKVHLRLGDPEPEHSVTRIAPSMISQ
jgi:hypothetical protein